MDPRRDTPVNVAVPLNVFEMLMGPLARNRVSPECGSGDRGVDSEVGREKRRAGRINVRSTWVGQGKFKKRGRKGPDWHVEQEHMTGPHRHEATLTARQERQARNQQDDCWNTEMI